MWSRQPHRDIALVGTLQQGEERLRYVLDPAFDHCLRVDEAVLAEPAAEVLAPGRDLVGRVVAGERQQLDAPGLGRRAIGLRKALRRVTELAGQ